MTAYMELVRQVQSGTDEEKNSAFNRLMKDFQQMVFYTAYARLDDRQLAEDVTQEAFLTAYKRINQLRDPSAFPSWLKRIVFTQADRITRRDQPVIEPIEAQYDLASSHPTPEDAFEEREMRDRVQIAIDALPEHERDVTRDFYLKGESQQEISEKLNIPLATVKKRLQYAREHLKGLISGFNETLDRAIYGNPEPQKQYQPVYIYTRRRDIDEDYYS